MKMTFAIMITCLPMLANAQAETGKGIKFEQGLTWGQILHKAKKENKFIFVDFYASWCGPCKAMDIGIYSSDKVSDIANDKFISIKIQQDKTPLDNAVIKSWYRDADSLAKEFTISVLPSLLFFSPDGKLINKVVGYQNEIGFITLLKNALTAKFGYQLLLEEYRQHSLAYKEMASLALEVKEMGSGKLADSIATNYKTNYLYTLPDSELLTTENLHFIASFSSLISSKERIFNYFYMNPAQADKMTEVGYSKRLVKFIISKEEIDDKIFLEGKSITMEPDWEKLQKSIKLKYGNEYANLLVSPSSRIAVYRKINNWKQYTALINSSIKKYRPEANGYKFANATMVGAVFQRDDWNLNSSAWDVFLHCNDESILKEALKWSDLSISVVGSDGGIYPIDQYYDTKANLLYKLGKVSEAIRVEAYAYGIAKKTAERQGQKGGGEGYLATLEKMKAGIPTWKTVK